MPRRISKLALRVGRTVPVEVFGRVVGGAQPVVDIVDSEGAEAIPGSQAAAIGCVGEAPAANVHQEQEAVGGGGDKAADRRDLESAIDEEAVRGDELVVTPSRIVTSPSSACRPLVARSTAQATTKPVLRILSLTLVCWEQRCASDVAPHLGILKGSCLARAGACSVCPEGSRLNPGSHLINR